MTDPGHNDFEKLACSVRVFAKMCDHRHKIRFRCTDRSCPHVIEAKRLGKIAIHEFDLRTLERKDLFEDKPEGKVVPMLRRAG